MNNHPIGILDSGVGGLSIWKEIVALLPHESTVYIADSANCPYGSKTPDEIYHLAKRLVAFLISKNCKLIILACNTITVSCLDLLRENFPNIPIVGTVPVVKTAASLSKKKRIGILSTITTAESSYQKNLIEKFSPDCQVINRGTDALVPFVEKGIIDGKKIELLLQQELEPFQEADVDCLALGCSHFPFLKPLMQKILGSTIAILDSGGAVARQTKRILEQNNACSSKSSPEHYLYTTGDTQQFSYVAAIYIGAKEKQQTNHRSDGEGTAEHFNNPKIMSLENAIEYIDDTELVEVTPKNIRIRKIDLNG